jgi:hypothetical protein
MIIKLPPATIRELDKGWLYKEHGRTYKHAHGAELAVRRHHKQLTRMGFSVLQQITWEPTTRSGRAAARALIPNASFHHDSIA